MMKKIINIVLIILLCFLPTSCKHTETPKERIKRITGIEVPEEAKLIFEYRGNTFSGRAPSYFIFQFEEEPSEFLNTDYTNFAVNNENSKHVVFKKEGITQYQKEYIEQDMDFYKITDEYKIDFDKPYLSLVWKAYFIYSIETKKLYFNDRGY